MPFHFKCFFPNLFVMIDFSWQVWLCQRGTFKGIHLPPSRGFLWLILRVNICLFDCSSSEHSSSCQRSPFNGNQTLSARTGLAPTCLLGTGVSLSCVAGSTPSPGVGHTTSFWCHFPFSQSQQPFQACWQLFFLPGFGVEWTQGRQTFGDPSLSLLRLACPHRHSTTPLPVTAGST